MSSENVKNNNFGEYVWDDENKTIRQVDHSGNTREFKIGPKDTDFFGCTGRS